ncbi:chromosome partitioning protein ParB, partial [Klebsiella pneumoniae]|nr:chromosome partitioning protein ParB [Klebsiella pneumoniae]MBL3369421.1 chromosome partitioning protein ParB [Klebsiella pneumoniae]
LSARAGHDLFKIYQGNEKAMLDAAQQLLRMKKQGEKFEPMRIIQALQDFIKTNAKDTQKTEKAYGEGVVAKYNGNYVTLKFDNRKIPSSLMKKIEELLESELEKK